MILRRRTGDKSDLYIKIFLALLVTAVLFVCIVSMLLYISYRDTTLGLINTYVQSSLAKTGYSAELMNEYAKMLTLQIMDDRNINNLFYTSPTADELAISLNRMNSYLNASPRIQSIYVYTGRTGNIYSTAANHYPYDKSSFFDQDIFSIMENMKHNQILRPIARLIKMPNSTKDAYVFTFILFEWKNTPTLQDNIIILNISEKWMRETVSNLGENPATDTIIIDSNGTTMIGTSKYKPLTSISGEDYVKKVLKSANPTGYFIDRVDGKQALVAYETSDLFDWKFISVIPYDSVTKKIESITRITIEVGFGLVFLGLIISLIIAKRLYKPIDMMICNLKQLESAKTESLYPLKEEFLRNLLLSRTEYSLETITENFKNLKMTARHDLDFCLMLIKIDHFQEFCNRYNSSDRSLIRFALGNLGIKHASTSFNCDFADMQTDHITLLCNPSAADAGQWEDMLGKFVDNLRTEAEKQLSISVTVTVTDDFTSIDKISGLYNKALDASYYRLFLGHGSLIRTSHVEKLNVEEYIYPTGKEKQLISELILGRSEYVDQFYREIIENTYGYSCSALMLTIQRLAFSINSAVDLLEKSGGLNISFSFNSFISDLNTLETIEEINRHFSNLFSYIIEKEEERKNNKHDAIFDEVIQILSREYSSQGLSLESIAPRVGMSSAYLGRLFKKATTKSISEYLTGIRLEKAKDLLAHTSLSAGEISEKVGFINSSYFFTIFKKSTGLTPSEYKSCKPGVQ